MAGIADGAVIEVAHLSGQGFAKGAETAGSVECFVQNAVERKFFQLFQRLSLAQLAVDDGFAGLAVFVDDAVGAPGQIIVERIRWKFRQRADAHAHVLELVEARGQIARDDGDESGSQSALWNERGAGAFGELLDHAGAGDVFG